MIQLQSNAKSFINADDKYDKEEKQEMKEKQLNAELFVDEILNKKHYSIVDGHSNFDKFISQ